LRNLEDESMRKGIVVGVLLFVAGSLVTQSVVAATVPHGGRPESEERYLFCFVHLEEGTIRNYQGFFFGIPISAPEYKEFGIGSFSIDLVGRIAVNPFHRAFMDGHVSVKGFIGFFQPTGSISGGALRGFALVATCV
jgi:hypothetical protein